MTGESSVQGSEATPDPVENWQSRPQYQAISSPIYRAAWEPGVGDELFEPMTESSTPDARSVMDRAIELVRRHVAAGTLWGTDGRVREAVLSELAAIGYWGLMVDACYGGSSTTFRSFAPFLTRMAAVDPTVAALGSVHSCIGATKALQRFGSEEQRQRMLPDLAHGRRLAAFALTEPGAGSDLTALSTYAELRGNEFLVFGEKLFVTNLAPGRTLLLICRIEGETAALVCELPDQENESFRLQHYGLHALRRTWNRGVVFSGFPVPAANRLRGGRVGGLTVAYHGLNYARISLCANAAGTLRRMLADMTAWVMHRRTYGRPIAAWQLVRHRLARLAGFIVACDALVAWGSGLMDQGYRGELEGMIAKIFASDSLREAAVELTMKTHGGRAFLHGHPWGDRLYDYLAPSIYEGEGELLRLALFNALAKHGGATAEAEETEGKGAADRRSALPASLRAEARQALRELRLIAGEIRRLHEQHGTALAEPQGQMAEISDRVLTCVVMLCTSHWAACKNDEFVRLAARIVLQDLSRRLDGHRPGDVYFRDVDRLGEAIVTGRFTPLEGIEPAPILMP